MGQLISRYGYAGQPEFAYEVQLLWYLELRRNRPKPAS
jgi:hypothetical protein